MHDFPSIAPNRVLVAFPRPTSTTPLSITVTLASLDLDDLGTLGFDGTKTFHSSAVADGSNQAQLTALAQRIATDYYLHLASRLDRKYANIHNVPFDGLLDAIEWTWRGTDLTAPDFNGPEISTRLLRSSSWEFSSYFDQASDAGSLSNHPAGPNVTIIQQGDTTIVEGDVTYNVQGSLTTYIAAGANVTIYGGTTTNITINLGLLILCVPIIVLANCTPTTIVVQSPLVLITNQQTLTPTTLTLPGLSIQSPPVLITNTSSTPPSYGMSMEGMNITSVAPPASATLPVTTPPLPGLTLLPIYAYYPYYYCGIPCPPPPPTIIPPPPVPPVPPGVPPVPPVPPPSTCVCVPEQCGNCPPNSTPTIFTLDATGIPLGSRNFGVGILEIFNGIFTLTYSPNDPIFGPCTWLAEPTINLAEHARAILATLSDIDLVDRQYWLSFPDLVHPMWGMKHHPDGWHLLMAGYDLGVIGVQPLGTCGSAIIYDNLVLTNPFAGESRSIPTTNPVVALPNCDCTCNQTPPPVPTVPPVPPGQAACCGGTIPANLVVNLNFLQLSQLNGNYAITYDAVAGHWYGAHTVPNPANADETIVLHFTLRCTAYTSDTETTISSFSFNLFTPLDPFGNPNDPDFAEQNWFFIEPTEGQDTVYCNPFYFTPSYAVSYLQDELFLTIHEATMP